MALPASDPAILGSIDAPDGRALVSGSIVVAGWAVGRPSPVSFVDVWLGSRWLGRAGLGRPRPDVARAVRHADAELSGFELRRALAGFRLVEGRSTLRAVVTLLDGTRESLPEIPIDVAAPEVRVPARALEPPPASSGPAAGPRLRILWFERALGRGGSQLRLLELLRELAATERPDCTVMAHADGLLRAPLEDTGARVQVCEPFPFHDAEAYERRLQHETETGHGHYDLVVGHTLTSFPAIDLARRLGLPSVWRIGEAEELTTVAGWIYGTLHPAVEARAREAFPAASLVVFNSNAARRVQCADGARGRFVVVKPGVDAAGARDYRDSHDRQECRQALGLAPEQRVLVCLGQLWPLKGQALLVRALRQAVAARGPLACVLIGDPTEPCAGSLRRFVTEQGLGETVRLVPFLDDPRPWLVSADVAVCPSESESMPASVLEAMAFGLPVLASRVGDVPELVVPGRSGWLFEPCHLGSLSSALEQVAAAPAETLREMGAEGARRMAAEHDRAASLRRMRELLVGATA